MCGAHIVKRMSNSNCRCCAANWARQFRSLITTVALTMAVISPAFAVNKAYRAFSAGPTLLALCEAASTAHDRDECKSGLLDKLAQRADSVLQEMLGRVAPLVAPLLKRDQVWFNEMTEAFVENSDGDHSQVVERIEARIAALETMTASPPNPGVTGCWVNAFGLVELTPAGDGRYNVVAATRGDYGADIEKRRACRTVDIVSADVSGWLAGAIVPLQVGEHNLASTGSLLRLRLHQGTLRVVSANESNGAACDGPNQLSGTFFFVDPRPVPANKVGANASSFIAPSFDCLKPVTSSEEEICADPDLVRNDLRLNNAWSALQPRLDRTTRHCLAIDR